VLRRPRIRSGDLLQNDNENIQWLRSRRLEWRARIEQINNAQRFLYATTYYIEGDTYGRAYLDALSDAARRNVDVRVLIDDFGQELSGKPQTTAQRSELATALNEAVEQGVKIQRYRPSGLLRRRLGHGHHIKIQVSDEGTALFGSSNITARSFELWNELTLLLRGPIVEVLLKDACSLFAAATNQPCVAPALPQAPSTPCPMFEYWTHDPNTAHSGAKNPITDGLIRMIDSATRWIAVTSFFYKPMPRLAQAMERACQRGVRVEVFHSVSRALVESQLPYAAGAPQLQQLLTAGGTVYENAGGEHAKTVTVDGSRTAIGSYNFEWSSHDRVAEAMLVTGDTGLLSKMNQMFERLREDPANIRLHRVGTADRLLAAVLRPIRRWV